MAPQFLIYMWVKLIKRTKFLGNCEPTDFPVRMEVSAQEARRLISIGAAVAIDYPEPESESPGPVKKFVSGLPSRVIR